jgi:hypothetical protein
MFPVPTNFAVVFCLFLAAIYLRVWPRARATGVRGLRYWVLRWFHSLVWVLLGAAVWVRAQSGQQAYVAAGVLAVLGLVTYVVFLIAVYVKSPREGHQ